MLSIDEINKLQKDLDLEHKANQRYSEMLIEYKNRIDELEKDLAYFKELYCLGGEDD